MVWGGEMLFNQTWLTKASCQPACPLRPAHGPLGALDSESPRGGRAAVCVGLAAPRGAETPVLLSAASGSTSSFTHPRCSRAWTIQGPVDPSQDECFQFVYLFFSVVTSEPLRKPILYIDPHQVR